jgi:excisionase family DNA binding protein
LGQHGNVGAQPGLSKKHNALSTAYKKSPAVIHCVCLRCFSYFIYYVPDKLEADMSPTKQAPEIPTDEDKTAARDLLNVLDAFVTSRHHVSVDIQGRHVGIPGAMIGLLKAAAELIAAGRPVTVLPLDDADEVSAQDAAELLKVSRPYVLNLLKRGVLPYRMVGVHHRIRLNAVIAYKQDQAPRRRALTALTAETQELDR